MAELLTHRGDCHYGAVRLEVGAPAELELDECNCPICSKTGYLHLIVLKARFRLLQGAERLCTYTSIPMRPNTCFVRPVALNPSTFLAPTRRL